MGIIAFGLGVTVIAIGAALVFMGQTDPNMLWVGSASIIGGILTSIYTFTKGPVSIAQKSVADLAQVETAFLFNIRAAGLSSFAFLKKYFEEKNPDPSVLEIVTKTMRESAETTMLLIEMYSGGNDLLDDALKDKKDLLAKRFLKEYSVSDNMLNTSVAPPSGNGKAEQEKLSIEAVKIAKDTAIPPAIIAMVISAKAQEKPVTISKIILKDSAGNVVKTYDNPPTSGTAVISPINIEKTPTDIKIIAGPADFPANGTYTVTLVGVGGGYFVSQNFDVVK